KRRVRAGDQDAVGVRRAVDGVQSGVHVVKSDQVYAQSAQAPGDPGRILLQRKVRAEGQVDAVESDALVIFGIRRKVVADRMEVPVLNEYAVSASQGMVQETEIGSAPQVILVNRERINRPILRRDRAGK